MWQDALRIMKDYLPHKVSIHSTVYSQLNVCNWIFLLQLDEFQKEMAARSGT